MSRLFLLVTGGAGFIGSHVVDELLAPGKYEVYRVNNFDPFYDPAIKLNDLQKTGLGLYYHFIELNLRITATAAILLNFFRTVLFHAIVHLAARVGVKTGIGNSILHDAKINDIPYLLASGNSVNVNLFIKQYSIVYQLK